MLSTGNTVVNSTLLFSLVTFLLLARPQSAIANLTFLYSGTVTSVENAEGSDLLAQTAIGSTISGSFSYDLTASPNEVDPRHYRWIFPSVPGSEQQFNITGPTFRAIAPSIDIAVYRIETDTLTYGGTIVQYQDSQVEFFPVPPGMRLVTNGFGLAFISRNVEHSTYPNLPASFLPLDRWDFEDPDGAIGRVFAYYYDSNDLFQGTMVQFHLDQVVAVPEPSSFFLVGIAVLCMTTMFIRKLRLSQVQC